MPPYILCSECERVPVVNPGDICEACQRKRDKQDTKIEKQYDKLTRKPHNWRDAQDGTWRRR